jgi:hypothetical protein
MRTLTLLAIAGLLCGCSQSAPAPVSVPMSDEQLRMEIDRRGWKLDHYAAAREKVQPVSGLAWPHAATQDDVLGYGKRAWGLPPRLMGKALRAEFSRLDLPVQPDVSLVYVDGIGRAASLSETEPALLLKVYSEHRQQMESLGLGLWEGVALVAGISSARKQPHSLYRDTTLALDLLSKTQEDASLAIQGVRPIGEGRSALALISDIDRLMHQHEPGQARMDYLHETWGHQWELLLNADSRDMTCTLLGEMKCATGATHQRLEEAQNHKAVDDTPYLQATANLDALSRALSR